MPNGKGQLDCCYCKSWRSLYSGDDGMYDAGFCARFNAEIPSMLPQWTHRICSDFEANEFFEKYLKINPLSERFSWFENKLRPGILYGFSYNTPYELEELKRLQELDINS